MAVYDRLSALDRIFLDIEGSNTHMHVAGVFLFEAGPLRRPEGGIDIDRLRAYVASRLHLIPRYRQRIARIPIGGHPVWVDDERFNVEYHVRHTCLPHPGDDRQLERLCGRIISQQLDRGKPLWEMWIVEGLEHERLALVSKVHHCMVDGVSGIDLLQVLLAPTPSVMQWCDFMMSAKRPSSRPSTAHASQSGLPRSSCCDIVRAARRLSARSSPGRGRAVWRT